MGRQKIKTDTTVRHGDVTADVNGDGSIVTITVGTGDDHQHLETDSVHAIRLSDVLAAITEWGDDN